MRSYLLALLLLAGGPVAAQTLPLAQPTPLAIPMPTPAPPLVVHDRLSEAVSIEILPIFPIQRDAVRAALDDYDALFTMPAQLVNHITAHVYGERLNDAYTGGDYDGDGHIRINVIGLGVPVVEMNAAHELAHMIDLAILLPAVNGKPGLDRFASDDTHNSYLKGYWHAVVRSRAYQSWHDGYARQRCEIFARALSQYLALRSHDDVLKAQLLKTQAGEWYQWPDQDFEPIAKALDRLFGKLGWLRQH